MAPVLLNPYRFGGGVAPGAGYAAEVTADSPVVWYRHAETSGTTVVDASGSGRDIAYTGTPTYAVDGAICDGNKGINLNGSSAYASSSGSSAADTALKAISGSFTVEVWSRLASVAGQQAWIDRYGSGVAGTSAYLFYLTGGKARFLIRGAGEADVTVDTTSSLVAGVWNHIVGVYDDVAHTIKIYLNGALQNTVSATLVAGAHARSVALRLSQSVVGGANGDLDESSIYGSALSAARVLAHYKAGISAYSYEVLQDSPWGYWKQTPTSGTNLLDWTQNARAMTITGTPTRSQTGPSGTRADGIKWLDSSGATEFYAKTAVNCSTSTVTIEAWVYLTALPTNQTGIVCFSTSYGGGGADKYLYIGTDGKVRLYTFNSGQLTITDPNALSLGVWHHLVASVGAAGTKLRIDKATVATNVSTGSTSGSTPVFVHGGGSDGTGGNAVNVTNSSEVIISDPAVYTTQLSDARTDAHYDAVAA